MINKNTLKKITPLLLVVFLISQVGAFAISSQYWEQNPVKMYPGEEKEVIIVLQNMAGTDAITAKGSIAEGSDIAKIDEKTFTIPLGQKTETSISIKIPETAVIGSTYKVKIAYSTTVGTQPGNVGFASSVEKVIPVEVIGKQEAEQEKGITGQAISGKGTMLTIIIIILAILIIITITVIWKRKKMQENKQSKKSR